MPVAVFVIVLLAFSSLANGQDLAASQTSPLLQRVGIDQKLNAQVPLGLQFTDESGKTVKLQDYFGHRPVVLSLVYYECPMLCTLTLNGMLRTFRTLSFNVGDEFEVVTVSINPSETPQLASEKKNKYLKSYGRPSGARGWHFLTGKEDQIKKLADAVGFRYMYDKESEQYAHAAGIMVATPNGHLARYFYGIEFPSRDLRLSLIEASANRIGSPVDKILLYCLHYDPLTGKYGVVIKNILRLAGLATVLILGGFIALMLSRERARKRVEARFRTT